MHLKPRKSRRRPGAVRAVLMGVCAAAALGLTGCSGGGGTADAGSGPTPGATTAGGTAGKAAASADTSAEKPAATASSDAGSGAEPPTVVPAASKSPVSPATGSPGGGGDGGGGDCDHKMPISPDEVAVYRYTPEGGSLSLIVRHGNWGCGTPDSDGAPFETVGKETYIPMDQAADITVTNPIVESTENQPIGVQEFLDWLEAHPDSGLVFTYHLGADGAIDRLDEVFTP
ncbi:MULTISPECIES: hypothetical protein [unclassified Streptomyces]|uniref:hypothetical protein n=1 Tax=unclassified Streptomyces TaxID=2593676 RepID=UPI00070FBBE2|nr:MULTISPECIES: hypothetical protein [unclassified Streptomyces]KRD19961.1 hypothetical protein ASE41_16520 [Streptomyces sp. Root264]